MHKDKPFQKNHQNDVITEQRQNTLPSPHATTTGAFVRVMEFVIDRN